MVAQGVKGIAITPTSAAVVPALNKARKAGVKVVLMDNDIPTWKGKTSVVATNNFKGGVLAGKFLATKLKAGDTLGILEGVPGVPALDARVTGMLSGLGALRSQIKVVSKLRTDCDQTKGAAAAQTMLTANQNLTAIYGACGPPDPRRDPVDQERRHLPGRHHRRRLRRSPGRGRSRSRPAPRREALRSSRRRSARSGSQRSTGRCRARRCRRTSIRAPRSSRRPTLRSSAETQRTASSPS